MCFEINTHNLHQTKPSLNKTVAKTMSRPNRLSVPERPYHTSYIFESLGSITPRTNFSFLLPKDMGRENATILDMASEGKDPRLYYLNEVHITARCHHARTDVKKYLAVMSVKKYLPSEIREMIWRQLKKILCCTVSGNTVCGTCSGRGSHNRYKAIGKFTIAQRGVSCNSFKEKYFPESLWLMDQLKSDKYRQRQSRLDFSEQVTARVQPFYFYSKRELAVVGGGRPRQLDIQLLFEQQRKIHVEKYPPQLTVGKIQSDPKHSPSILLNFTIPVQCIVVCVRDELYNTYPLKDLTIFCGETIVMRYTGNQILDQMNHNVCTGCDGYADNIYVLAIEGIDFSQAGLDLHVSLDHARAWPENLILMAMAMNFPV
jgi:hypothetical protein